MMFFSLSVDYAEVKWLYGSRKLTLTAYLPAPSDPAHFLSCDLDDSSFCPLDIKLNLMVGTINNWFITGLTSCVCSVTSRIIGYILASCCWV